MSDEEKERLVRNPASYFGTKNPELQKVLDNAPKLLDYLEMMRKPCAF